MNREKWETGDHFGVAVIGDEDPGGSFMPLYLPKPFCAVGAIRIDLEIKGDGPAYVLPVINEDRVCPMFFAHRHDFSPKEHQQMWMAEQLQKLQNEQREMDRRYHAERSEKDAARQDARDREAAVREDAREAKSRWWTLIGTIGGAIVGAILGYLGSK